MAPARGRPPAFADFPTEAETREHFNKTRAAQIVPPAGDGTQVTRSRPATSASVSRLSAGTSAKANAGGGGTPRSPWRSRFCSGDLLDVVLELLMPRA